LSAIDIVILLLLLLGAYKGFSKGLLLEVIGILAFFVALVAGFKLLHWAMKLLSEHVSISESFLPYAAFLLLFAAIVIGINLMGKALKRVLDMTFMGTFDNLAGAIIGLFKWALAISIFIWLIDSLKVDLPSDALADSYVYPLLQPFAPKVFSSLGDVLPTAQSLFQPVQQAQP
jgi:membrane protein required for colicin V production